MNMKLSHRGSVVGLVVGVVLVALLGALVGAPGAWAWPDGNTPPDKTLTGAATGLNAPMGVAFDASGRMYVTNYGGDSVTVYSADWATGDTAPVKTLAGDATGLNEPGGVAFDASGRMYVPNEGDSVTVYSADWADGDTAPDKTLTGDATGLKAPEGVAFDASGTMYVTNYWGDSVTVYAADWADGDTAPVKTLTGDATGLNAPGGVAFDASGRMYVTNIGGDSVTVYSEWDDSVLTPTFNTPVSTADGFTVNVTNYDPAWTWPAPTATAGSATAGTPAGSTLPITVTGLSPGGSSTVTVTTTRPGYDEGTADVAGSASATAVPGPARSVGGVAGNGRAIVSWTAPASTGGSAVTGYRIQRRAGSGSWATVVGNTGSVARSRMVTGLSNGTSYTFRVAAINSAGVGAFSSASSAVKPVGKPGKPGEPKVKAEKHGKARIHWDASASHGGKVTYMIQKAVKKNGKWRKVASTTRHKWNGKVPGATKAAKKGRALWFRIVPANSAGTGPKSKHTKAWMKK
ncbi:MAG: fibronectin type III domain-containing protein [Candidatus Nanopelagicales bacterium]|nr:fibronectin type III domain-containing protein [Candidatus Nanopelagicales bacterium]